jgi:UDP-N-acetylglucosamine/UDP-N-acetylgalactosamine diphosphorylase
LAYGTVIAAGSVCRKDELKPDRLIVTGEGKPINAPFNPGFPKNRRRIVMNNLVYIANLMALMQWYKNVRSRFISDEFPEIIFVGMKEILKKGIHERIRRLEEFLRKHPMDPIGKRWPEVEITMIDQGEFEGDPLAKDAFLKSLDKSAKSFGNSYISTIQGIRIEDATVGTTWLQGIVDHIVEKCRKALLLESPDKSSSGG